MSIENIPQIFIKDAEKSPDLFVYDFVRGVQFGNLNN